MRDLTTSVDVRSEQGPVREKNEDAAGFIEAPDTRPGVDGVYVVADGLGGHEYGEVASAMAVRLLLDEYRARDPHGPPLEPSSLEASLAQALRHIDQAIHHEAAAARASAPSLPRTGMATTVTAALLAGRQLSLGHVGDSRAYLLRQGRITLLTQDHSLVAEQVRRGILDPGAAERHPMRHILTQTVGLGDLIAPFTDSHTVQPGDRLLLCTDGLTGFLGEEAIAKVVAQATGASAADALVREAIEAGGNDNVTVLLVSLQATEGGS